MEKFKFPLKYNLKIKRGVIWSTRRVEVSKERLKYFKPESNELRFDELLQDCTVSEQKKKSSTYSLVIGSKTNKFKEVRISHEDLTVLAKFKEEFEQVQQYKKTLCDLENKTFVFDGPKSQPLNESIVDPVSLPSVAQSVVASVVESPIGTCYIEAPAKTTQYEEINDMESKFGKENVEKSDLPLIESEILDKYEENLTENLNWNVVKYNYSSMVEYNGDVKEIIPYLEQKEYYIQKELSLAEESFGCLYHTQRRITIAVIILFVLSLALMMFNSFSIFISLLIILTTGLIYFNDNIKQLFPQKPKLTASNDTTRPIQLVKPRNDKYIRITSIYNNNARDVFEHFILDEKRYKRWNENITRVDSHEDGTFGFVYSNEVETTEIKIKRNMLVTETYDVVESLLHLNPTGAKVKSKIKIFSIEPSSHNQCRLTIIIPVKHIVSKLIPTVYLSSTMKSLDCLHVYLANENFERRITAQDSSSVNVGNTNIKPTNRQTQTSMRKKRNSGVDINMFYEMGNRFSEASVMVKPFVAEDRTVEAQPKKEQLMTTDQTQQANVTIQEVTSKITLDPVVEKENDEIRAILKVKYDQLDEYLNRPWKVMEEKNNYKLYYLDEKSGLRNVKSECIIDVYVKTLWDFVIDVNNKGKYEKNFECGHIIRMVDDSHLLQYTKYKGKAFVNPRDFTVVVLRKQLGDDYITLSTSIASDKYPKVKGVERADLKISGFILKRIDDFKTHLTYFSLFDLKLSQTLVNTSLKDVALCVKQIKDIFD